MSVFASMMVASNSYVYDASPPLSPPPLHRHLEPRHPSPLLPHRVILLLRGQPFRLGCPTSLLCSSAEAQCAVLRALASLVVAPLKQQGFNPQVVVAGAGLDHCANESAAEAWLQAVPRRVFGPRNVLHVQSITSSNQAENMYSALAASRRTISAQPGFAALIISRLDVLFLRSITRDWTCNITERVNFASLCEDSAVQRASGNCVSDILITVPSDEFSAFYSGVGSNTGAQWPREKCSEHPHTLPL